MRYATVRHTQRKSLLGERLAVLPAAFGEIGIKKGKEFSLRSSAQMLTGPQHAERSLGVIDSKAGLTMEQDEIGPVSVPYPFFPLHESIS